MGISELPSLPADLDVYPGLRNTVLTDVPSKGPANCLKESENV
jgi:hypothetical protein